MVLDVAETALIMAVGVQAADSGEGKPSWDQAWRQVWGCGPGRREHVLAGNWALHSRLSRKTQAGAR